MEKWKKKKKKKKMMMTMMFKNAVNSWKVVGFLVGSIIMVCSTVPIISDC
jgi:hypothetical protein